MVVLNNMIGVCYVLNCASCQDLYQSTDTNGADLQTHINQNDVYFIAKVRLLLSCMGESPSIALLLENLKK